MNCRKLYSMRKLKHTPCFLDQLKYFSFFLNTGHQLNSPHTFRSCPTFPNYGRNFEVEAGSGVTIMSYAGICGNHNVQDSADPYFHSFSLERMRIYIEEQASLQSCGTATEAMPIPQPIVSTNIPDNHCTVPVGNYVQLNGQVDNPDDGASYFYSWDRIDPRQFNYLDTTISRFMVQTPNSASSIRYLPNLYLGTFEDVQFQSDQYEERIPLSPIDM